MPTREEILKLELECAGADGALRAHVETLEIFVNVGSTNDALYDKLRQAFVALHEANDAHNRLIAALCEDKP